MGREVRKVPPNWNHPKRDPDRDPYRHGGLQPMHDEHFEDAFTQWLADFDARRQGKFSKFEREVYTSKYALAEWLNDDGRPPDPIYYRPWKDDEATWFQLWETVSEGTPTSPPFATKEELVQYLADNGDFWDQKRCRDRSDCALFGMEYGKSGWGRKRAEAFVMGSGWAPSMIVTDGRIISNPGDMALLNEQST